MLLKSNIAKRLNALNKLETRIAMAEMDGRLDVAGGLYGELKTKALDYMRDVIALRKALSARGYTAALSELTEWAGEFTNIATFANERLQQLKGIQ